MSKGISRRNQKSAFSVCISRTRLTLPLLAFLLFWRAPTAANPTVFKSICSIQGSGFSSPYKGWTVQTQGIVTMDLDLASQRGFFLQADQCDTSLYTSDGIFVYLGERSDVVNVGDRVEVSGLVQEYYGMTELKVAPQDVLVLSRSNPLPAAQALDPPFQNDAARSYFERLEGMYVSLSQGRVVGPTDSQDRTWLVNASLGVERVFFDDPQGTGEVICAGDDGLFKISPEVKVGDTVLNLVGALDFRVAVYCLEPAILPLVQPAGLIDQAKDESGLVLQTFSIATFNLAELFDTLDDPDTNDEKLSYTEYQRRLRKRTLALSQSVGFPAILAVQEIENLTVLEDLIAQPEIQAPYAILWLEGLDRRGLDIAILYRTDQVNVISYQSYPEVCTNLVDGLEPDGNGDLENPQNALTCDMNGDGVLDGNRLFSRPPLAAHLLVRPALENNRSMTPANSTVFVDFWVINNHFKSKVQDTSTVQYTLPRRLEQARFVASLARQIRENDPQAHLIVLGDLNDHPNSSPLTELTGLGFQNAMNWAQKPEQYTYIYHGISQTLDYILYSPHPYWMPISARPVHINADYPESYLGISDSVHRSSDHDPLLVSFAPVEPAAYLPVIQR